MANVVYLKWGNGFFNPPRGFEWELALGTAAFMLLFTGPAGRISLDRPTPWGRRPVPLGLFMLIVAAGLSSSRCRVQVSTSGLTRARGRCPAMPCEEVLDGEKSHRRPGLDGRTAKMRHDRDVVEVQQRFLD
ncbi:hypothetical protein [Kibdelosporangium philippinense]|uniref:hypothetical protein n=1 Tax=Kibdelosporangium philippinense TaxID=211113 RepID=UPI003616BE71